MNSLLLNQKIAEIHREEMLRAAEVDRGVRTSRTAPSTRGVDLGSVWLRIRRVRRIAFRARGGAA